jgi:hypothetical protein
MCTQTLHNHLQITCGEERWVVNLEVNDEHYRGEVWVKLHDPRVQANPERLKRALEKGDLRKYTNAYALAVDFVLTDSENNNSSDGDDDDDDIFYLNIYLSKVEKQKENKHLSVA